MSMFACSLKHVCLCPVWKVCSFIWPGGSLRGRGWKYGSGFVDGIFPVLSPTAQEILDFLEKGVESEGIWSSLDKFPATLDLWDDIFTVAVQLRMRKKWDSIIWVRNSHCCLQTSRFFIFAWLLSFIGLLNMIMPLKRCYNIAIFSVGLC